MYGKIGIRNFWAHRRRNIFTLIAVSLGTIGLMSLGAYINRWEHTLRTDAIYLKGAGTLSVYKENGHLMAQSDPKRYTLTAKEQTQIMQTLESWPEVEHIGKYLQVPGLASNGCQSYPFQVTAYDPLLDQQLRSKPEVQTWCSEFVNFRAGKPFAEIEQSNVVGLATGLARMIGKRTVLGEQQASNESYDFENFCLNPGVKDRIANDSSLQLMVRTFDGFFNAIDVDVGHIYTTGMAMAEDTKMTAPLDLVQSLYETDRVTSLAVYTRQWQDAAAKAEKLQDQLRQQGLKVDVYPWNAELISPFYVGIMNFLYVMGLFFAILIASVVILAVVNLTSMNVLERSREIGTLKSIGYRQQGIAMIFLAESAVLGLVGIVGGLLISFSIFEIINGLNIRFSPPGFADTVQFLLIPDFTGSSMIVGFIFILITITSFVTSYRLARRSCLELLTH